MHPFLHRLRTAAGQRALLAALPLAIGGCTQREAAGDEIAIAVALNPQRPGMQSVYNGVQLAVTDLNRERAAKGARSRLVMLKGAADVTDPVKIAVTFRDDPRVVGVVGHPESGTTLA